MEKYIQTNYFSYLQIFTDGSKVPESGVTGIGIFIPEFEISIFKRLSNNLAIYTLELVAIMLALQWIEDVIPVRVIICSDSKSALNSLVSNKSIREDILNFIYIYIYIYMTLKSLNSLRIDVKFCCTLAHTGINGNEIADQLAKKATKKRISRLKSH